jgi:hypothetical protein
LRVCERGKRIVGFAVAIVEGPRRLSDAAKVEPYGGNSSA